MSYVDPTIKFVFMCLLHVQDLTFTLAVTKLKGYFEALFEQPPPFKLSLVETDTDQIVWSATIREGTVYYRPICLIFYFYFLDLGGMGGGVGVKLVHVDLGSYTR